MREREEEDTCHMRRRILDQKRIQYNYLDMTKMPHKTMTYLRNYCISFPIVLNINNSFSNFEETLTHFRIELFLYVIFILLLYYYYYYIPIIILKKKRK